MSTTDPRYPDAIAPAPGEKEWPSVEAERDYWKALAQSYGAKLTALRHVLDGAYEIVIGADGLPYAVPVVAERT